jgi:hypothetical protein
MRFNQDYLDYLDDYLCAIKVEPTEPDLAETYLPEGEFNASPLVANAGCVVADKGFSIFKTLVSRIRGGSRTEPGPNTAHNDTKRGYLLRSYVRCGLCDQRMFGKTRHGRAYYNCYPANNNADRLDRYPADHPKAIYVREDALVEALGHVIATRVFGPDRHAFLQRGLAGLPSSATDVSAPGAPTQRTPPGALPGRERVRDPQRPWPSGVLWRLWTRGPKQMMISQVHRSAASGLRSFGAVSAAGDSLWRSGAIFCRTPGATRRHGGLVGRRPLVPNVGRSNRADGRSNPPASAAMITAASRSTARWDRIPASPHTAVMAAECVTRGITRASVRHQGTTPASSKNPPVGPSSGRVASRIAIAAPCSGVRTPRKPLRSVATKPGQAALIRMFVARSSLAY